MATLPNSVHRLVLAGGFVLAATAAPVLIAAAGSASSPVAQCPANEVLDPSSGACRPVTDPTNTAFNPVDPGITGLQPGGITSSRPGDVGSLPEVNGIPCQGDNTGLCLGLEQNNAATANVPHIQTGVTG